MGSYLIIILSESIEFLFYSFYGIKNYSNSITLLVLYYGIVWFGLIAISKRYTEQLQGLDMIGEVLLYCFATVYSADNTKLGREICSKLIDSQ